MERLFLLECMITVHRRENEACGPEAIQVSPSNWKADLAGSECKRKTTRIQLVPVLYSNLASVKHSR